MNTDAAAARLLLRLAYDGTDWHGWQIQERALAPPTIQGEVERALQTIYGRKIRLFGAGRTDAGVHAHAQAAHCDVPRLLPDARHALNSLLPPSIRVLAASPVHPTFHARKDALAKTYVYTFWREPAFTPPHIRPFCWACGPLDAERMRAALPHLRVQTDFSSLQNSGTDIKDPVRRIFAISLEELPRCEFYPPHLPPLRLSVNANGFLKQMARNIAGLLAWCGRGRLDAGDIPRILAQKSRAAAPSPTAPACGLALAAIEYGPTSFTRENIL